MTLKLFVYFFAPFLKELSHKNELLEKLTKISEECSAIESDATKSELSSEDEADYIQNETSDTGLLIFYMFVKPTMQKKN